MQTQQSKFQVFAQPYLGTVVQVQVTDGKHADATIKIPSVCTAVPGYGRASPSDRWKHADATIKFPSVCTAVPGYGRASPSDRWKTCRRNNQNSKCLHNRTRVQQTQQSKFQVFAQPYPGTADATIKIPSVCTAVPGYGRASPSDRWKTCRRNNQNSKCLHNRTRRVQQTQQSKFQVFAQPYPGTVVQAQVTADANQNSKTVPGYSRRNTNYWLKKTWA